MVGLTLAGASTLQHAQADDAPSWAEPILADDSWREPFQAGTLEDTFGAVARGIRYEPYPGVMRGPRGTAVAGAGNAWDQALMLATLLRQQGYRVRFARGRLPDDNRLVLLRGLYPPVLPAAGPGIDYTPFDLNGDAALHDVAQDHLWLEVAQGDGWLPLDPAFPQAEIGAAYARAEEHFDEVPKSAFARVSITLKQLTSSGETRELFTADDTVERWALRPLWLTITSSPLMPAEKRRRAASLSFNAPSEPSESSAPPKRQGINQHWAWGEDQTETRRGTVSVLDDQPALRIEREWLEIVFDFPDGRRRTLQRDLLHDGLESTDSAFRRYQLLLVPGRVPVGHADAVGRLVSSLGVVEQYEQTLRAAHDPENPERALALEQSAGALAHYLMALRFAAESDALSDRIAWVNGVALVHHQPRLLITSTRAVTDADKRIAQSLDLDLRLDEVSALPYPGFPERAAVLFQTARGIQQSMLEGALLAELNQAAGSLSTARFMEQSLAAGVPLEVLYAPGAGNADMPQHVRARLDAALAGGARIILPERAVEIDGLSRWGWWQIDPTNGLLIGVMDNGLHAGMTEYSLDLSKIALDDRMGMVIGAIVGATSTEITIAALILEHGEYGPALVEAVVKILERITCLSCPEAKASAGAGAGASASVSIAGDCLSESKGIGVGGEVGANIKVGSFCDAYVQGFKCASGLILNGLTTEISTSANAGLEKTLDFGCD